VCVARKIIYFSSCAQSEIWTYTKYFCNFHPSVLVKNLPRARRHRRQEQIYTRTAIVARLRHQNPSVSEAWKNRSEGERERQKTMVFFVRSFGKNKKWRLEKLIKYNVNIEPRLVLLYTRPAQQLYNNHCTHQGLHYTDTIILWCSYVTYGSRSREKEERNT